MNICCYIFNVQFFVDTDLRIQIPLSHKEAIQGDAVTFECKLHPLSDPKHVRIKWKHKGSNIDTTQIDKYQLLDESQSLVISNLNRDDAGEYTCVVIKGAAKDRSSATLTVKSESIFQNINVFGFQKC